jgi:hypothetical protein
MFGLCASGRITYPHRPLARPYARGMMRALNDRQPVAVDEQEVVEHASAEGRATISIGMRSPV